MSIQATYQKALKFAAEKHIGQTIPGTEITYVVHVCNVAFEIITAAQNTRDFNTDFAIEVALLHDTIEDTDATFDEIETNFGTEVAHAVMALSKSYLLPKHERMADCLNRIKQLQKEVGAVKLADRIINLQKPPQHWNLEKIREYQKEAIIILQTLKGSNEYLEQRLKEKIKDYAKHCVALA